MFFLLNTDAWKHGGTIGFILFSFVTAVGIIWKYFTTDNEKVKNFFAAERNKYEEKINANGERIKELQDQLFSLQEEHIKELQEANRKLQESNSLLNVKLNNER